MGSTVRELEVVVRTVNAEHHAVEAFMILEASDDAKTKTLTVHRLGSCEIADRSGNAKVMRFFHSFD
jgi:hypothetical protein